MSKIFKAPLEASIADHLTIVYVIAPSEEGPSKIGVTKNIQARLAQLQTAVWEPLKLIDARIAVAKSGGAKFTSFSRSIAVAARGLEAAAHKVLRDCDLGLSGEWFDVTAQEAIAVIDKCASLNGFGSLSLETLAAHKFSVSDPSVASAQMRIMRTLATVSIFREHHQPLCDTPLTVRQKHVW